MRNFGRIASIFFIWMAFAGVGVTTLVTGSSTLGSFDRVLVIFILSIMTTLATFFVWRGAEGQQANTEQTLAEKGKRNARTRLTEIISDLSDAEADALLSDLRQRLATQSSDGEISALEALLLEREEQAHRGKSRKL